MAKNLWLRDLETEELWKVSVGIKSNERYPMCKDQPAQIDCRREDCKYHQGGACVNVSPAITLKGDITQTWKCWSYEEREPELKPCPFCGGSPYKLWDNKDGNVFWVSCFECGAKTARYKTREDSYAAWNKRTL